MESRGRRESPRMLPATNGRGLSGSRRLALAARLDLRQHAPRHPARIQLRGPDEMMRGPAFSMNVAWHLALDGAFHLLMRFGGVS